MRLVLALRIFEMLSIFFEIHKFFFCLLSSFRRKLNESNKDRGILKSVEDSDEVHTSELQDMAKSNKIDMHKQIYLQR